MSLPLGGSYLNQNVTVGTNLAFGNVSITNASITTATIGELRTNIFSQNILNVSQINASELNLPPDYVIPFLNVSELIAFKESFIDLTAANLSATNISAISITAPNVQPTLTAGNNIDISGNTISATGILPSIGNFTELNTSILNASNISTGDLTIGNKLSLSNKVLNVNSTTNITQNSGDLITSGAVYTAINGAGTGDSRSLTNTTIFLGTGNPAPAVGVANTIVNAGQTLMIMEAKLANTKFGPNARFTCTATFTYDISGFGADKIEARLKCKRGASTNTIAFMEQIWVDKGGGGTRSGVLSPLTGSIVSGLNPNQGIDFFVEITNNSSESDDTFTLRNTTICNITITESLDNNRSDLNLNTGDITADAASFNSLSVLPGSGAGKATIGRTQIGNDAFSNMMAISINGNVGATNYGFAQIANNQTIMNAMPGSYNSFRSQNNEVASINNIGLAIGYGVNNTAPFPLSVSGSAFITGIGFISQVDSGRIETTDLSSVNTSLVNVSTTNSTIQNLNVENITITGNINANSLNLSTANLVAGDNIIIENNIISAFLSSDSQANINSLQVDNDVDVFGVLNVSQTSNFRDNLNIENSVFVGKAGSIGGEVVLYSPIIGNNYVTSIDNEVAVHNTTGLLDTIVFKINNVSHLIIDNSGTNISNIITDKLTLTDPDNIQVTTLERQSGATKLETGGEDFRLFTGSSTIPGFVLDSNNIVETKTLQNAGLLESNNISTDGNVSIGGALSLASNVSIGGALSLASNVSGNNYIQSYNSLGNQMNISVTGTTSAINYFIGNQPRLEIRSNGIETLNVYADDVFSETLNAVEGTIEIFECIDGEATFRFTTPLLNATTANISTLNINEIIIDEFELGTINASIGNFSTINVLNLSAGGGNLSTAAMELNASDFNFSNNVLSTIPKQSFTAGQNIFIDGNDVISTKTNVSFENVRADVFNISDNLDDTEASVLYRTGNITEFIHTEGRLFLTCDSINTNVGNFSTINSSVVNGANLSTASINFTSDFTFDTFSNTLSLAETAEEAIATLEQDGLNTTSVNTSNLTVDGLSSIGVLSITNGLNSTNNFLFNINSSGTANISNGNFSNINSSNISGINASFTNITAPTGNFSTINASNIVGYQETLIAGTNISIVGNTINAEQFVLPADVNFSSVTTNNLSVGKIDSTPYFDTFVIRRLDEATDSDGIVLNEIQLWVNDSNLLVDNSNNLSAIFADWDVDKTTPLPSIDFDGILRTPDRVYNNIIENPDFGTHSANGFGTSALIIRNIPLTSINTLQSIMVYNRTNEPRIVGLAIELYNSVFDPLLINDLANTNVITSTELIYRFDFPAIVSYTGGFATTSSTTQIASDTISTTEDGNIVYRPSTINEINSSTINCSIGNISTIIGDNIDVTQIECDNISAINGSFTDITSNSLTITDTLNNTNLPVWQVRFNGSNGALSGQVVNYNFKIIDNRNTYNTTLKRYVIPEAGNYFVYFSIVNNNVEFRCGLRKNGGILDETRAIGSVQPRTLASTRSYIVNCAVDDFLDVNVNLGSIRMASNRMFFGGFKIN